MAAGRSPSPPSRAARSQSSGKSSLMPVTARYTSPCTYTSMYSREQSSTQLGPPRQSLRQHRRFLTCERRRTSPSSGRGAPSAGAPPSSTAPSSAFACPTSAEAAAGAAGAAGGDSLSEQRARTPPAQKRVEATHGRRYGRDSSSPPRSAGTESAGRDSSPPIIGPTNSPIDHVQPSRLKARPRCDAVVTSASAARQTPPMPEKMPPQVRQKIASTREPERPKPTSMSAVPTTITVSVARRPARSLSHPHATFDGMPANE
mmetsp:Transcript_22306/g.55496  ORF Transcript_22306/g.55496 Transcript_22306/m.55496 type:complete len:260 (+) Transcript_22306:330-1109(+)